MSDTITKIIKRTPNSKNRDMFRSLLVVFPVLWVTALTLGPQQSASAAEFNVGGGDSQALIQAIKDANANAEADVINLDAGVYTLSRVESEYFDKVTVTDPDGSTRNLPDEYFYGPNGLPLIESDIKVRASAGSVVIERSGVRGDKNSNPFRFFHVRPGATLRLEGITLRNGFSKWGFESGRRGGAILNEGVTIISDSVFTDNAAGDEGGAIMNRPNALLEVHTSTFERNTLTENNEKGGALGGAIINVAGRMSVDRSTFNDNTTCLPPSCSTEDGDGGAIENVAGEAIITNSVFFANKSVSGGAVENNRGKLTIVNSTFYKNVATKWAGAIGSYAENSPSPERITLGEDDKPLWGEGIIVIINSTIVGNHAGDDAVNLGSPSTFGGGGILTQKGVIVLKNTILAGNTAPAGMPQDCTGYPYFHDNPVYIISAGNNIIGDTKGCLTVPQEMPWKGTHTHAGEPLLVTLKTDSTTDLTGNPGVGSYDADPSAPGRGHLPLSSSSPAINAGDNDLGVKLNSKWVGGHVCAFPATFDVSHDQLGNAVVFEVRDIGSVEYSGSEASPSSLLPLNLPLFNSNSGVVDCAQAKVFVATGGSTGSNSAGGGAAGGGSSTSGGNGAGSTTSGDSANEGVPAGQSAGAPVVSPSTSTTGGGALGPLGILLMSMLALNAGLRHRRCATVMGT